MTFDEAWKVAFADNKYRKPQEIGREVFLAGQRSGFSLGTEAAAHEIESMATDYDMREEAELNTRFITSNVLIDGVKAIRALKPTPGGANDVP
jgi:hypothetical protein